MLYALDCNNNNKIVNIFDDNVESRRASNKYICISCKKDATANKGKIKKYLDIKFFEWVEIIFLLLKIKFL